MINDPFEINKINSDFIGVLLNSSEEFKDFSFELTDIIDMHMNSFLNDYKKKPSENFRKDLISLVKKSSSLSRSIYLKTTDLTEKIINEASDLGEDEKQRYHFLSKQILNFLLPSNFFWTNPSAVNRYLSSDGESLFKGLNNLINDFTCEKLASLTNKDCFKIGENIAETKGKVVYKNKLFELIQYESVTEKNYKIPVVMIQPWINKYYIFDLKQNNSFVKYLIDQGFTVFITSWKNPDSKMKDVKYEDYLFDGILKAVETANQICKTSKSHVTGYCIGGTALLSLLGTIKNNSFKCPFLDISLFATLADFSKPGDLSFLITEKSIKWIEELIKKDGFLKGKYIEHSFRTLKSESLIWPFFVNNYLNGAEPPASDLLFWNTDSTGLPEKMCIYFLREFYLNNKLIKKNGLIFRDLPCDISKIDIPVYAVGAEQDHIAPWKETMKVFDLLKKADIEYLLTSEGHIAGFINPPSLKSGKKFRKIFNNLDRIEEAFINNGSWWLDWAEWLKKQDCEKVSKRKTGSSKFPNLYNAPGKFVFE